MSIKRPEGGEHHEPPKDKSVEQREPEKPVQEILEDWIEFPRVKIIKEDEDTYTVEYNGEEVAINKAEMEHQGGAYYPGGGTPTIELRQQIQQVLQPMHGLFLDREIPAEFREAIIFHELREREHSGDEDPHQRAVHDEILYVIKHFSPELRRQYFEFAEKEREEKSPQKEINPEELLQHIEANGLVISQNYLEKDEETEELVLEWSNDMDVRLPNGHAEARIRVEINNANKWFADIGFNEREFGPKFQLSDSIKAELENADFEIQEIKGGLPRIFHKHEINLDNRNGRTFQRSVRTVAEKAKALLEIMNKAEQK